MKASCNAQRGVPPLGVWGIDDRHGMRWFRSWGSCTPKRICLAIRLGPVAAARVLEGFIRLGR